MFTPSQFIHLGVPFPAGQVGTPTLQTDWEPLHPGKKPFGAPEVVDEVEELEVEPEVVLEEVDEVLDELVLDVEPPPQ